ncbi:hypothetical protein GIB67_034020 [Kingdonia uniflora]|uniref:Uncharacterized protein n=1 Tax=Kingdonia uniflora TaxID=39325 RepID=A0A7J7M5Z6_9MAGN|nr:hypothetical protein GIB67_034020 [Kingdonia uniflora]
MAVVATSHQFYIDDNSKLSKKDQFIRSTSSSGFVGNSKKSKKSSFSRKCASLVKEQRARFYIMRRCVTMLICWRDYADS